MPVTVMNSSPAKMGKFQKALGAEFRPMVIKLTGKWGKYALRTVRKETNAKNILWKKRFYRGWAVERSNWHTIRVYNRAKHAVFVEEGRRAGSKMPPDKPIRDWVKSQGIPERATFLIRKKIARRGIKARRIMSSPALQKRMSAYLKRLLTREMNRYLREAGRSV